MTWTMQDTFEGIAIYGDDDDENGAIATVYEETHADLIAAAPDLLHALRLMLREHDALQLAEGSTEDRWTAATLARVAINKAEGNNVT